MAVSMIRDALLWCFVINTGLLLWWLLLSMVARNWIYRMHSKWFKIPMERFDAIHYSGMAYFKMGILFLNLVPYLALLIVGG